MNIEEIFKEFRKFKGLEILSEVKFSDFLNNEIILSKLSEDVFSSKVFDKKTGKWIKPFDNNDYAQILYNSLLKEKVDIDLFVESFEDVYEKILKPFYQGGSAPLKVKAGNDSYEIKSMKDLTFSMCKRYINLKKIASLNSASYIKCLSQGFVNKDFEIVGKTNKYLIFYPKTTRGSITLARSYYDEKTKKLVYDNTFSIDYGEKIGVMKWCTAISGSANFFNKYHVKEKIHMYYFISLNSNIEDRFRKICIGLEKKEEKVKVSDNEGTLADGNNTLITYDTFIEAVGKQSAKIVFKDARSEKRQQISIEKRYQSFTLEDYISLKNDNKESLSDIANEVKLILNHSYENTKIAQHIIKNETEKELIHAVYESNLLGGEFDEKFLVILGSNFLIKEKILKTTSNVELLKKVYNSNKDHEIIVYNPNIPLNILNEIFENNSDNIRMLRRISKNTSIDKNIFEGLANNSYNDKNVIANLIANKSEVISLDWKIKNVKLLEKSEVKKLVFSNQYTTLEEDVILYIIEKFKKDKVIKSYCLINKGLSASNFLKYIKDEDEISYVVADRLDIQKSIASSRNIYVLSSLASNTNDRDIINHFIYDLKRYEIHLSLLFNKNLNEADIDVIVERSIKQKSNYNIPRSSSYKEVIEKAASVSSNPETLKLIAKTKKITKLTYAFLIKNKMITKDSLEIILKNCPENLVPEVENALISLQESIIKKYIQLILN